MRWPLFPLTALAPTQVWSQSYVHGSGALTTRGASWSGDGVAMAACDEPAPSGVALPADNVSRRADGREQPTRASGGAGPPPRRTTPDVRSPAMQP
jgi:hypothetical protein